MLKKRGSVEAAAGFAAVGAMRRCARCSASQAPSASSGTATPVTRSGEMGMPAAFSALAP